MVPPAPASQGRRPSPTLTLLTLGIAGVCYATVSADVLPALPTFQHALHTSVDGASWILITFLLSASVATPIVGRLGDMYGKDRLLLVSLGGLTLGSLLGALANSIVLLDVARVVQGIGGVVPVSFGIIRDELPPRRLATSIGLVSAMIGGGGAAGIVIGALIAEHLSWHWLFWVPLIPSTIGMLLAWRVIPPSPVRSPARINWVSAILMSSGIAGLLIAVSEASTWGWGTAKTLGLMAAGLVLCVAWIAWELRSRVALVDMGLMRMRPVWTTNLAAVMLGGGLYSLFLIVPAYTQEPRSTGYGLGASIVQSGLYLLPTAVASLLVSLAAGRIAHRFGSKRAFIAGTLSSTISFVVMLLAHRQGWNFYVTSALFGSGIGLSFAALGNLVVEAVPRTHTAVASSMNAVMRTLGGAVGAALVATLIAASSRHGVPAESGYLWAMGACAVFNALAAAAGLLIPSRSSPTATVAARHAAEAPHAAEASRLA